MNSLKGYQKRYLRGRAHALKPVVLVGQKELTDRIYKAVDEALKQHELIKIKLIDATDRNRKKEIIETITSQTESEFVGMTGHIAIIYRAHADPEKRKIMVPEKDASSPG